MENLIVGPIATFGLPLVVLISIWTLVWKGWALWLAARRAEKWWFIALLVLNTLAILEIVYIFFIAKRSDKPKEPKQV
jgi:hypothetical protein|tara:strand:+ start:7253 stop:7486 length:234 start_codon:yes stop_codon:yes gene_type:complete